MSASSAAANRLIKRNPTNRSWDSIREDQHRVQGRFPGGMRPDRSRPHPGLAAQSPACPNKAVAYLNAQDKQEDTEAAVDTAQRAYNEAKDDQAKLDKTVDIGGKLLRTFHDIYVNSRPAYDAISKLDKAVQSADTAATADAAVAEADAAQKALDGPATPKTPTRRWRRCPPGT
ncbi:hypothetical protein [Streptomyces sp. NPDC093589]|uniref:hypothetical protein n=1 Tax=Streptomyces sp. NPDC093589 TaxID=3366043 RepID=UPI003829BC46